MTTEQALWKQLAFNAELDLHRALSCYGNNEFAEATVFSAVSVEKLIKSALAHANPALLAGQDVASRVWFATISASPRPSNLKTVSSQDAIAIAKALGHGSDWPKTTDLFDCRNEYLHLGGAISEDRARSAVTAALLVTQSLLASLSLDRDGYLNPNRELANSLLEERRDEVSAILADLVAAAKVAASHLTDGDREAMAEAVRKQLAIQRVVPYDQIVDCPVCGLPALVDGELIHTLKPLHGGMDAVDAYGFYGTQFRCNTCHLFLNSHELVIASKALEDWEISDSDLEELAAEDAYHALYG